MSTRSRRPRAPSAPKAKAGFPTQAAFPGGGGVVVGVVDI